MRILMPLPDTDFDVTEVAVPWHLATEAGHEVVFATEAGDRTPAADPRLLTGVIFGKLGAAPDAIACYRALEQAPAFQVPVAWGAVDFAQFDGLILPGGHAPGMRQYLGSEVLHAQVARFWRTGRPVGAICHGVVVLARAIDPQTGHSVLRSARTTCLPRYMEWLAYALTCWKLGRYYRTYRAYVQAEVEAALADPRAQLQRGPITLGARGTVDDDRPAFVVEDGRYVSARWPGDAWRFGRAFLARLAADSGDPTP